MLIYEKSRTQAPFNLTLDQEGAGGLTGKTPTLAFRDATTTDSYLDWGDSTFKTSGWAIKYLPMTEVERGHYTSLISLSAIAGIVVGSVISAEYHVDDGGAVKGEDQETLLVVETIDEIATDVVAAIGSVGVGLTAAQATQLIEIWQVLGLDITHPLTVSKTARSAGSVIGQKIEENVPTAGSVKVTRQ